MRFASEGAFKLIEEKTFAEEILQVEKRLEECKNSGFFDSFDGKKIYFEYFLAEESRASVVIVHGLSEFTKKYYETAYYFLNKGYNVFVYDIRSHGFSHHYVKRADLLHIERFSDLEKELGDFLDKVVLKASDKPIYLYAHSMGGGAATLYMAHNPEKVRRAVLIAPLFAPYVGNVNSTVAKIGVGIGSFFCGKKRKFPKTREFDPNRPYSPNKATSQSRYEHNLRMRAAEPNYQSTPRTWGMTYEFLKLEKLFRSQKLSASFKTPTLIFMAENDRLVRNDIQREFAQKCSCCRLVELKDSTHAILGASDDILNLHYREVFEFFED